MQRIATKDKAFLLGMGIGLYWGEGHKRNNHFVRFANTDPSMIKVFIKFLREIWQSNRNSIWLNRNIHTQKPNWGIDC